MTRVSKSAGGRTRTFQTRINACFFKIVQVPTVDLFILFKHWKWWNEKPDVISVPGQIKYDKELRYGDVNVNGDNSADIADAVMIIRYDIGLTNFTDEQKLYSNQLNNAFKNI